MNYLGNLSQSIVQPPKSFILQQTAKNDKRIRNLGNKEANAFSAPKKIYSHRYYRDADFLKQIQFSRLNVARNYRYQRPIVSEKKKLEIMTNNPANTINTTTHSYTNPIYTLKDEEYNTTNNINNYKKFTGLLSSLDFKLEMKAKTNTLINSIYTDRLRPPAPIKPVGGSVCLTDNYFPKILVPNGKKRTFEEEFNESIRNKVDSLTTIKPSIKEQISYRKSSFKGKNEYFDITHQSPTLKELFNKANLSNRRYKYY